MFSSKSKSIAVLLLLAVSFGSSCEECEGNVPLFHDRRSSKTQNIFLPPPRNLMKRSSGKSFGSFGSSTLRDIDRFSELSLMKDNYSVESDFLYLNYSSFSNEYDKRNVQNKSSGVGGPRRLPSVSPVILLNIKNRKLYQERHHISSYIRGGEKTNLDSKNTKTEGAARNRGRQIGQLLTRQFLKNEGPISSTQQTSTTQRIKSRVSRDNRQYLQSIHKQSNLQEHKLKQNLNRSTRNKVRKPNRVTKYTDAADKEKITSTTERTETTTMTKEEEFTDSFSRAGTNQIIPNIRRNTLHRRQTKHYPPLPIIQPFQQNKKLNPPSRYHQAGGRVQLSGSSSSPVEPIKPLLQLGGRGGGSLPQHPVFDVAAPKNLSGLTGNSAYMHCLVHNLANRSVSWIRQRDLHILTVDRYTYTTDERFEVIHSEGSKDWILKIKYAQVRDSGKYECQVSTKPVMSYVVKLNIYAPQARIVGAPDMHVDSGSTINLTCVIAHSPEPPAYIFWYHNDIVVNYDSPRGGITVVTERGNVTTGYLLIQDAKGTDSGNYSCAPSNTAMTSLRVHVLNGELPAAMQTSAGHPRANSASLVFLLVVLLVLHITTVTLGIRLPRRLLYEPLGSIDEK